MDFKPGNSVRRPDRRICPKCERRCGTKTKCPDCGKATKPRLRIVWTIQGKRYRELTNCWTAEDAKKVLLAKEADYGRQQRLGVSRDAGGTIESAIAAFEREKEGLSKNWQAQIRKALEPLAEGLGQTTDVTEIRREDIREYLEDGLLSRSPTTMRSYLIVVRCFFRWLEGKGWVRFSPAQNVWLPRAGRRLGDFLRPEEVGRFLAACRTECSEFAPIATAIVLGSFRKGEIVNLRHQDLDLERRWAFVLDFAGDENAAAWSPKTEGSRRAIPLHPHVVAALAEVPRVELPDGSLSPWVFPVLDARKARRTTDRRGRRQPMRGDRRSPSTTYFGKCLRLALVDAGIERRVTIHGLRRTFSVLLQDAGAPDSVIRQAMGHAERGVTDSHSLARREAVAQRWVDRIDLNHGETSDETNAGPYMAPDSPFPGPDRQPGLLC